MKKNLLLIVMLFAALFVLSCGRTFPPLPSDGANDEAPIVVSASAIAINQVQVLFSEDVDSVTGLSVEHYSISNNALGLVSVSANPTNRAVMILNTSNMSAASNYILSVTGVQDEVGNTNLPSQVSFNGYGASDTSSPGLSITEPVASQLIGKSFLVYGTASDDSGIDHVEVKVDGGSYVTASNTVNWSYLLDTSVYNESYDHLIYVKAVDLKGNATVNYVTVSIDRTDPTMAVTSAPSGVKVINAGDTITLTGTASDNVQFSTVGAYLTNYNGTFQYGGTWTSGTDWEIVISDTSMLDESTNTLTIVAQDLAGNISVSNLTYTLYRNIIYVRTNGTATGDGTYWFPRDTIQNAGLLTSSWARMWVADGQYTSFLDNVSYGGSKIMGGYSQDFVARDISAYNTELNGTISLDNHVLTIEGFKIVGNITDTDAYTETFVSNLIMGDYTFSVVTWPNVGGNKVFTGNTFSNSSISFNRYFNEGNGIFFTNNVVYGEVDATTGATTPNGGWVKVHIISNKFVGMGGLTNTALQLTPVDGNFNGSPAAPSRYHVRFNIFSNYYVGVQYNDSTSIDNRLYVEENMFYTRDFGFLENTVDSDPDSFISNQFNVIAGYLYYDFDRTPEEVSALADLNALDEGGFNPASSVYSNW